MMAAAALVILGVILVLFGILATGVSYPLIALGIVSLIAAGALQVMQSRNK
jgi:hypothetical protein